MGQAMGPFTWRVVVSQSETGAGRFPGRRDLLVNLERRQVSISDCPRRVYCIIGTRKRKQVLDRRSPSMISVGEGWKVGGKECLKHCCLLIT